MIIWKQGQFYPELGKKVIELPNKVSSGPSDAMIKIDGFNVQADKNGDFVVGVDGRSYTEDELDAINTYAVIRMVINIYEDLLGKPIQWSWWKNGKGDPLLVKIRNNDINARFIKDYKCIELDYYGPYNKLIYNCRTVDLIAHETGHAILDNILPHLNEGSPETRGIGEAFCDLTSMFWILSQKDLCEYVIHETGGDLSKPSILSLFGIGHGFKENKFNELRSALNKKKYVNNSSIPYDYSQILVGALFEILIEFYTSQNTQKGIRSRSLYDVGFQWTHALVQIFKKLNVNDLTISGFKDKTIRELRKKGLQVNKPFNERNIS